MAGDKSDVVQTSETICELRKKVEDGVIEMFTDKLQFKHHSVKDFMDQFMPR